MFVCRQHHNLIHCAGYDCKPITNKQYCQVSLYKQNAILERVFVEYVQVPITMCQNIALYDMSFNRSLKS